jgi:mannose-6-phosphate isomerase-like protein (cupin superfamily)
MSSSTVNGVQVLKLSSKGTELPIIDGLGTARAVIWPGMGATERCINYVELEAGSSTVWLGHATEAVYYVMSGTGTVLGDDALDEWPIFEGSIVHISDGSHYRFQAQEGGLTLFGGPCPTDPAMFDHLAD